MNDTWQINMSNKNREDIILAGKSTFLKNSFHNVKITDICTLAGVSRVTFYKYFSTLDELIFEIQTNILNNMTKFIKERSDFSGNGKESVKSVLYTWIEFAKSYMDEMKFIVFFDLYYSSYDFNEELKVKYKSFTKEDYNRSLLKSALDKGIKDSSLKEDVNVLRTGTYIYQTIMGLLQRLSYTMFAVDNDEITFNEVAVKAVEVIISSIEK